MDSQKMALATKVMNCSHSLADKLVDIWTDMGFPDTVITTRLNLMEKHILDLCSEMYNEAKNSRSELEERVEKLKARTYALRQQLKLTEPFENYDGQTLFYIEDSLTKQQESLEKQLEERTRFIKRLIVEEQQFTKALGVIAKELPYHQTLPSERDIEDYKMHIDRLRQTLFEREELYLKLKVEIGNFMEQLGLEPSLDFERTVLALDDASFHVTENNMERLQQWHEDLSKQLECSKGLVDELREKLSKLWELLEESATVRSTFLTNHTGYTVQTIQALRNEIARCEEKKKANIKVFVEKLRVEIELWWNKCRYGSQQRTNVPMNSDCFTEDLITLHEIQLDKLKRFYETHKHIFDLLDKREHLWQQMLTLEEKANCPNRFKNRGGELLNEEKERKSVASKLPQIEHILLEKVEQYQAEHGQPFLVFDTNIKDLIEDAWRQFREDKTLKLSARKIARDQTATPSKLKLTVCTPSQSRVVRRQLDVSGTKRKILTPFQSSTKRPKLVVQQATPKALPKVKLVVQQATPKMLPTVKTGRNARKRLSRGSRRRLDSSRRRSKNGVTPSKKSASHSLEDTIPDYKFFENELPDKDLCRSSILPERKVTEVHHLAPRPRTPLRTPHSSPRKAGPSRLTAASGLPIII